MSSEQANSQIGTIDLEQPLSYGFPVSHTGGKWTPFSVVSREIRRLAGQQCSKCSAR